MLYVVLSVLTGVLVLIFFKLFPKYRIKTFPAIIFNYITAGITGILFSDEHWSPKESLQSSWIALSIPLGGLFIFIFYLISQTTQRISISTASIANKMSVVIPVLFSFFLLGEELSAFKIAGILLALVALYMSSKKNRNTEGKSGSLLWLPVLVFIGSGLIDSAINASSAWFTKNETEDAHFTIATFFSAFSIGLLVSIVLFITGKQKLSDFFHYKNILAGVCLGIPNYFSIFFIFLALKHGGLKSSQLFPVLNLSNVGLSALAGYLIFREKLSFTNVIGIILAIASIIMIAV